MTEATHIDLEDYCDDPEAARKGTALSRTATGGQERQQRRHTPQCILDRIPKVWRRGIACDPCASPDGLVDAPIKFGPDFEVKDGLAVPHPRRTFGNPPWNRLKVWLAHFAEQPEEQILLIPVRTRRSWWRDFVWGKSDAVVWLDSICFDGFDHPFPGDCMLTYRGRKQVAFGRAFADMGRVEYIDREVP